MLQLDSHQNVHSSRSSGHVECYVAECLVCHLQLVLLLFTLQVARVLYDHSGWLDH